jgi:hypothetical protein
MICDRDEWQHFAAQQQMLGNAPYRPFSWGGHIEVAAGSANHAQQNHSMGAVPAGPSCSGFQSDRNSHNAE